MSHPRPIIETGTLLIACGFCLGIALGFVFRDSFGSKLGAESATLIGSFLGAFLGLLGLLIGALYNAKLNRERDDYILNQERSALAAALYAEIQLISNNIEHLLIIISECESGKRKYPQKSESDINSVYRNMVGKIGILGPDISFKIISFYGGDWSISNLTDNHGITQDSIEPLKKMAMQLMEESKDLMTDLSKIFKNPKPVL